MEIFDACLLYDLRILLIEFSNDIYIVLIKQESKIFTVVKAEFDQPSFLWRILLLNFFYVKNKPFILHSCLKAHHFIMCTDILSFKIFIYIICTTYIYLVYIIKSMYNFADCLCGKFIFVKSISLKKKKLIDNNDLYF